jgi:fructuronate reductase
MSRRDARARAAAPVRLAHLGLGNFFRAHQAWYTDRAPDAGEWGIAAFAGRGARISEPLAAQDGAYTLITRAADGDRFSVIGSVSAAYAAADHNAWLATFASPALAAVTITVTEAGYCRNSSGGLDRERPDIADDIDTLRRDPAGLVRTAPARLAAGLAARRRADAGPLTLVPCDNLPANGDAVRTVVHELASLVDGRLAAWLEESVSTVTTMVDRITPRAERADVTAVADATGVDDACPVVTEPFSEWVLSGEFVADRPRWEDSGATFTNDVTPFEHRKLWLLNGGHSLLAYAGSLRGHTTVAEAVDDPQCHQWLEQWWDEASRQLTLPAADIDRYRQALVSRFDNPRIRHRLEQIAADGSQKVPVRILPTLRAERGAGRDAPGATLILAAWVCHLRGGGVPVSDVDAAELVELAAGPLPEAVRKVLGALDTDLVQDSEIVGAVVADAQTIERSNRS